MAQETLLFTLCWGNRKLFRLRRVGVFSKTMEIHVLFAPPGAPPQPRAPQWRTKPYYLRRVGEIANSSVLEELATFRKRLKSMCFSRPPPLLLNPVLRYVALNLIIRSDELTSVLLPLLNLVC